MALGSNVPADTVPLLQTCPTADRHGTAIVAVLTAPTASDVQVHETVPPATVHVPAGVVVIVAADGPVNRLDEATMLMF